jgi:transposase
MSHRHLFVLRSGIPWQLLPQELGCGSGMTCWRRVRDWQQAGVWDLIHFALLDWLARSDQIDWSRAVSTRRASAPFQDAVAMDCARVLEVDARVRF